MMYETRLLAYCIARCAPYSVQTYTKHQTDTGVVYSQHFILLVIAT